MHSIYLRLILFAVSLLFLFGAHDGAACIWQDGDQPFWPSNDVGVCFLPLEQSSTSNPALVKAYNEARLSISQVVKQQINGRSTGFNLSGFKTCDYDYRTQGGHKDNMPPMIRIELTSDGRQDQSVLTNGVIGPVSGKKDVNILLNYAANTINMTNGKKDGTTSWKSRVGPGFQSTALHEILHIFGIHHEYLWDSPAELAALGRYAKRGDSMDRHSVMCNVQGCAPSDNGPVLSDGDIRCLQAISSHGIKTSSVAVDPPSTPPNVAR